MKKEPKPKKILTYVISIADKFPPCHPKNRQPTEFLKSVLSGEKTHTVRGNYEKWVQRAEKINNGEAILSLRRWDGKPYGKGVKPVEVARYTKIQVQALEINPLRIYSVLIDGGKCNGQGQPYKDILPEIAKNDGFSSVADFLAWFKNGTLIDGCIIHFTENLY